MATGGFIGYAPPTYVLGGPGANSIYLTSLVAPQNGVATAVLLHSDTGAQSVNLKALVYDGAHSALLAQSAAITSEVANYNRLPLTVALNLTAGTTYYVGFVSATNFACGASTSAGFPASWYVSGGQSVASPANPLVGGTGAPGAAILVALELDGTGVPGFGWGPDFTSGVTRSVSNTVGTFTSAANLGVRGIVTQVNGAGKFYAEVDVGGTINSLVGVGVASVNLGLTQGYPQNSTNPAYVALLFPNSTRTGASSIASGGLTYVSGDTIGIAYDCVNHLIWWNKNNGTWYGVGAAAGNPVAGTAGWSFNATNWPMTIAAITGTATAATFTLRDTAGALKYTPPSGYSAWSSGTYPVLFTDAIKAMVLA